MSRRANAVSSLHGEVSRAMWTELYPGKMEDAIPIGHITNGVHVPTWLAPQMARLYDTHFGTEWRERSSRATTWEGIENVDDGELWETHLSLKSQLLEFVRARAVEQSKRRGESATVTPETLPYSEPRCTDDRIRAPICDIQARQHDSVESGSARVDGE